MRIISGKYKGRVIKPPKNFRARPTTDLAKESLFNILVNQVNIDEMHVLDLFAGTGSVGFEFLSRGAKWVEFVEKNYIHYHFIRKVIRELEILNARVIKTDCFLYMKSVKQKFDLVFADPPYDLKQFDFIPGKVLESGVLKDHGIFILEHSGNYDFTQIGGFQEKRKYGGVNFSFFINN